MSEIRFSSNYQDLSQSSGVDAGFLVAILVPALQEVPALVPEDAGLDEDEPGRALRIAGGEVQQRGAAGDGELAAVHQGLLGEAE